MQRALHFLTARMKLGRRFVKLNQFTTNDLNRKFILIYMYVLNRTGVQNVKRYDFNLTAKPLASTAASICLAFDYES